MAVTAVSSVLCGAERVCHRPRSIGRLCWRSSVNWWSSRSTRLADGATWVTLADPAGHPFDLCQRDGVGPAIQLFAVTIDAPDASGLARFYADLLGMEVTYDGPEGALISGDGKSVMFQQVSE